MCRAVNMRRSDGTLRRRDERDLDAFLAIGLIDDLLPDKRGCHRSDALPVDQDLSEGRLRAVLQPDICAQPSDEVSDREAVVKRVKEVTNLRRVPDERSPYLGNRDLTGLHPGERSVYWLMADGVFGYIDFFALHAGVLGKVMWGVLNRLRTLASRSRHRGRSNRCSSCMVLYGATPSLPGRARTLSTKPRLRTHR